MSLPAENAWRRGRQAPDPADVVDHLPQAIFTTRPDGVVLSWNRAAARMFGYGAADATGRDVATLLGAEFTIGTLLRRAGLPEGPARCVEARARCKDGQQLDVELYLSILPAGQVVVTAADVSGHKSTSRRTAAELAVTRILAEAKSPESAFRRVLSAVATELGFAYAGLWTSAESGAELMCAMTWHDGRAGVGRFDAESRHTVLPRGDNLPGRAWIERGPIWIPAIGEEPTFPRAGAALDAGLHGAVALPVLVGGSVFAVMEFLKRERLPQDEALLATLYRIAAELGPYIVRIRAETEVRRSEQLFRTLAQTASDAILTMDARSVISFANSAVQKIFGYRAEELIGRRMMVLMPQRFRRAHRQGVKRYSDTGEKRIPWSSIELVGRHRDGHEVPIEISFGEFVSGGERVFTGIVRDITDRKEQHVELERTAAALQSTIAELEERTAQAEAASKAKSEFLAAMSHELRTPLQAVIGYTGLLVAGLSGPLTDDQLQKLSRVQLSAEHLLQLIDQVLDVARADVGSLRLSLEPIDLNVVVSEACDLVRPQAAEKGLAFRCAFAEQDGVERVHADRQRVRQILLNLLTNAVKFTESGAIEVRTRIDAARHVAAVEVMDTGIGLSRAEAELVFQPFYQAELSHRKRAPGTGLGLSISRRLAHAMRGDIQLESERGRGSRFTLTLPLGAKE